MKKLIDLQAIILDFDGVILESVDIKTKAFHELFSDFPEYQDRITQFHVANGGMSRYEKFRIIYRDFLKLPLSDIKERELGKRFTDLVFHKAVVCPLVPGAELFLVRYSQKYPLFIASATPHAELVEIVTRRNLSQYFKAVQGSPTSKQEIIQERVSELGLHPQQVLFIGDAINDFQAARQTGVQFVGRVPPGQHNPFPQNIPITEDLAALECSYPELFGTSVR